MKRFHIALTTHDLPGAINDYSQRLAVAPEVIVDNQYALWRTDCLNVSVRVDHSMPVGQLRHLGWEDPSAPGFSEETDVNGIVWERFSADQQAEEIKRMWPD